MKAAGSTETSASSCQTARRHIPERHTSRHWYTSSQFTVLIAFINGLRYFRLPPRCI